MGVFQQQKEERVHILLGEKGKAKKKRVRLILEGGE